GLARLVLLLGCNVRVTIAEELLAPLAALRQPAIGRDAVEPGGEARLLAKAAQVAPRQHERVLREVVGERMIARRELAQARAHGGLMAPDELRERMAIVVDQAARDELGIGDRRCRRHRRREALVGLTRRPRAA